MLARCALRYPLSGPWVRKEPLLRFRFGPHVDVYRQGKPATPPEQKAARLVMASLGVRVEPTVRPVARSF